MRSFPAHGRLWRALLALLVVPALVAGCTRPPGAARPTSTMSAVSGQPPGDDHPTDTDASSSLGPGPATSIRVVGGVAPADRRVRLDEVSGRVLGYDAAPTALEADSGSLDGQSGDDLRLPWHLVTEDIGVPLAPAPEIVFAEWAADIRCLRTGALYVGSVTPRPSTPEAESTDGRVVVAWFPVGDDPTGSLLFDEEWHDVGEPELHVIGLASPDSNTRLLALVHTEPSGTSISWPRVRLFDLRNSGATELPSLDLGDRDAASTRFGEALGFVPGSADLLVAWHDLDGNAHLVETVIKRHRYTEQDGWHEASGRFELVTTERGRLAATRRACKTSTVPSPYWAVSDPTSPVIAIIKGPLSHERPGTARRASFHTGEEIQHLLR